MNLVKSLCLGLFVSCGAVAAAHAAELTVNLAAAQADGAGPSVGTVRIVETPSGLAFYPQLTGLPHGVHGFHVHENPSCAPSTANGTVTPAGAAGGHFDPLGSKHHGEPWDPDEYVAKGGW